MGADAANRKAVQRRLADLKLDADVTTTNPSGSRTITVKLTTSAEAWARGHCGLPTIDDALLIVDRLFAMQDHPGGFHEQGRDWIRETTLAGCEYGNGVATGERLWDIAEQLLPALVAGLVISGSDGARHVSFSLATAGRSIAAERLVKIPVPASRPKQNIEAQNYYVDAREEAERSLASCKPSIANDIGLVPLSDRPTTRGDIAARCGQAAERISL